MEQTTAEKPGGETRLFSARRHWDILLPLGMTLAFVLLCEAVFGIRYEVNDDATISNIAAGAYGGQTHYLVYVNVLLGWALKPLYALLPGLNWFVVLLLCGGVLCYTVLGTLLQRRAGRLCGALWFGIFLVMSGENFFIQFHYVKYGALFITTGLLLVALHLGSWNKATFGGMALALVGSMLRFEQFIASGALAAALLLFFFFRQDKAGKKRAVLAVGLLIALCFAAKGVDYAAYQTDAGWTEYTRYNAVRTEISDYRFQFTGEDPTALAHLGYSANDYEVIKQWSFYDPEVFSLQNLEQIEAALPRNTPGAALKAALGTAFQMLYARPIHILFATLLLVWLFFTEKKRWPALVGILAMLGILVLFLQYRGRYMVRTDTALVMSSLVYCAACFEGARLRRRRLVLFVTALMAVYMLPALVGNIQSSADYWQNHPRRAAAFDEISADKDTLYLPDTYLVDAANGYDVWHARPKDYFSNIVFVGSWLMNSPFQNEALAAYGVENPYKDSLDAGHVLFLDYYFREAKEVYLQEHYAPGARLVKVGEHVDFNSYRAVSQPEEEDEQSGGEGL